MPAVRVKPLRQVEQELILRALKQTDGNRSQAARLLGISLRKLRYRLKEYREAGVNVPESAHSAPVEGR